MLRTFALFTMLLALVTSAQAESQKFLQRSVLPMPGSIDPPSKWQDPLKTMLARAQERCVPIASDFLFVVEEVVPDESVETGISRREAVRAFLSSITAGQGSVVVGTLTVGQSNARRALRGAPATAKEREVEVELVCSSR